MKWVFFSLLFSTHLLAFEYWDEGIQIERNIAPTNRGPRIAIVTMVIQGDSADQLDACKELSYAQQVAFGTKSKVLYARKHGYDLFLGTKKFDECNGVKAQRLLEASWSKIPLISKIIDEYDWVFWTDADSIILNFDIRLESFLSPAYDLVACTENMAITAPTIYCPKIYFINAGQVFYKNSDLAKEILFGAWNEHFPPSDCYEQPWINWYIVENQLETHVLVHPPTAFNSRSEHYRNGEFMAHMYGLHGDGLKRQFQIFEQRYGSILKNEERKLGLRK